MTWGRHIYRDQINKTEMDAITIVIDREAEDRVPDECPT
jgi:hypothetical protein